MMKLNFNRKTVLITGATRGIGKQLANDFKRAGARLILTGTDPKGAKKGYHHLDFLDPQSVRKFLKELKKYPKIDVCINNAGISSINDIEKTKDNDWDEIHTVNLKGPYQLIKALAPKMKKAKYGRIVNISSIFGVVTREKRSIYTSTKAGLLGLTRTTAVELAKYNILVNAVSPGFVDTDMTRTILGKKGMAQLKTRVPMKRLAKPSDISSSVLFLASDLNTYIAGQNIIVDGGFVSV